MPLVVRSMSSAGRSVAIVAARSVDVTLDDPRDPRLDLLVQRQPRAHAAPDAPRRSRPRRSSSAGATPASPRASRLTAARASAIALDGGARPARRARVAEVCRRGPCGRTSRRRSLERIDGRRRASVTSGRSTISAAPMDAGLLVHRRGRGVSGSAARARSSQRRSSAGAPRAAPTSHDRRDREVVGRAHVERGRQAGTRADVTDHGSLPGRGGGAARVGEGSCVSC